MDMNEWQEWTSTPDSLCVYEQVYAYSMKLRGRYIFFSI